MTEPKCSILSHNPPAGLLHLKGDHGRVEGDEIRRGRLLAFLRVWGETWRLKISKNIPPPFSSYLGRGLLAGYGGDISDCHGLSTVSAPAIRHDSETGSLNTQTYSHN